MKRAKIMLFAIVVLAAVGGALAFKAKSPVFGPVYCAIDNGTEITCTALATQLTYTTQEIQGAATTTRPCLTVQGAVSTVYCTQRNTDDLEIEQTVWVNPEG